MGERSLLADFLRHHRDDLMEEWERLLQERHPQAVPGGALLRDYLTDFLDGLAEASERQHAGLPQRLPQALSEAYTLRRLETGYPPEEAVLEYSLVRQCILQGLAREGSWPSDEELEMLSAALDLGITRVITHHTRVRERRLEALERVSQAALESADLDTFLPRLLRVLMELVTTVDGASLLMREGDRLRLRAAVGIGAEQALADRVSLALDEGITGQVVAERLPRTLRSVATWPVLGYERLRPLGLRAAYSVPLLRGQTLIGVAHMCSRTVFDFSESDKLLFRALLNRATSFIVQADLAERERAARAEAERSLAQVDMVLKASPVGIGLLDRELRYLGLNDTLARLNCHSVSFHQGKTLREVVPPWVADTLEPLLRGILETGQPVSNHEFTHPPDNTTRPSRHWLGNYYPVRTRSGEVLGLGCVVVDITQQKEVEAELRHSGELRERLIAVLGHDLRNPLGAISASATLLQRDEHLGTGSRRSVERIRNSAARMARMLSDILDFARSSMGGGLPVHRARVDLNDICRSTLEELQVAQPERRLELESNGDTWGNWDADRLAQVVGNLVSNALRHGRPDACVRVEVRGADREVLLSVHNEGAPIPPELLTRLFQPFQHGSTGQASNSSVGLGLYIVRQVARAHGGEVDVRSTHPEGTTFTVRLPRGEA